MADIKGTALADQIQGTLLQDLILAGRGDDVVDADEGNDVVYGGEDNDLISGGMGDDMLYGGKGNDTLSDGNGNDAVKADSGDDVVLAGHGDDAYDGGSGFDTLDFSAATQGMQVDVSKSVATGMGTDSVRGFEKVVGSSFDDYMKGSNNADAFVGGDGNDVFRGLGGADTFTAGEGLDVFQWQLKDVVDSAGAHLGVDRITDFDTADSLDLRALIKAERTFDGTVNDPEPEDGRAFDVNNYVQLVDGEEGLTLQVKHQGQFVDVALLEGMHGEILASYWSSDATILAY